MRLFYTDFGDENPHISAISLLRFAFSEIYGEPMPEILKAEGGKPYFPGRPDIHFSLSHAKGYALCAIGEFPVGADMEKIRDTRPNFSARVRSEKEEACFDLFSSWVLKESFIKLRGTLTMPLRKMEFTGSPNEIICPEDGVFAKLYATVDGFRAAVCSSHKNLPAAAEFVPFEALFATKQEKS